MLTGWAGSCDLQKMGLSWEEVEALFADKEHWRSFVVTKCLRLGAA